LRLDEAAAQRRRRLLVLAGEIVFADRAADVVEHRRRLTLRLQCLAAPAPKTCRPQYRVGAQLLVRFGERWQAHDLPCLLRQHMRGQIVPRVTPEGTLSCSRCMLPVTALNSLWSARKIACWTKNTDAAERMEG